MAPVAQDIVRIRGALSRAQSIPQVQRLLEEAKRVEAAVRAEAKQMAARRRQLEAERARQEAARRDRDQRVSALKAEIERLRRGG